MQKGVNMDNITLYALQVFQGLHLETELSNDIIAYSVFCIYGWYHTQKIISTTDYPENKEMDLELLFAKMQTTKVGDLCDELVKEIRERKDNEH